MSNPAERGDYLSAVQRLRSHIEQLQNIAEERLGLQNRSSSEPDVLFRLWGAISKNLKEIQAITQDDKVKDAARVRELAFDEIVDPIYEHMGQNHPDPAQRANTWATYRRRLRAELDVLAAWASHLIIVTYALAGQMSDADAGSSGVRRLEKGYISESGRGSKSNRASLGAL